jgi:hypothetical protein
MNANNLAGQELRRRAEDRGNLAVLLVAVAALVYAILYEVLR